MDSVKIGGTYPAHPSSFRDPDGFVFEHDGELYRCLNSSPFSDVEKDYRRLMDSGLYRKLTEKGWLVPHQIVDLQGLCFDCQMVLKPEQLPIITYPYEWSFGQLQQAALLTLDIVSASLDHGMILKDASAYNVTWYQGKPIFIDTLSFTRYEEGKAWQGYHQFCTNFMGPLALASHTDLGLHKLLQLYINGVPLELVSKLLPKRTRVSLGLGLHIHAHAKVQRKYSDTRDKVSAKVAPQKLRNLLASLRNTVADLKFPHQTTEWGDYYNDTNYSPEQFQEKAATIKRWLAASGPLDVVLDLGANDGTFSRIAAETSPLVVSADIDPVAVQSNFVNCRKQEEARILPMLLDISAPSPGLGWLCTERESVFKRIHPDLGMALAIIHHLAIGNNLPLPKILESLALIAPAWIVEFVDKQDSQVQRLLANREDIFHFYTRDQFEKHAADFFKIGARRQIAGMDRTLYYLLPQESTMEITDE